MKNFVLFVVAVLLLSLAGYLAYCKTQKGMSIGEAMEALFGGEADTSVPLANQAKDAYRAHEYARAIPLYESAISAHESGVSGAVLEEEDLRALLRGYAISCYEVWKLTPADESMRLRAQRAVQRFQDVPSKYRDRYLNRIASELRHPASQPS